MIKSAAELVFEYNLYLQEHHEGQGYRRGDDIMYQCPECGYFIPSNPRDYSEASCQCRNLAIDIDMGRFGVREYQPLIYQLEKRLSALGLQD
jgi:hypothetical protein